METDFNWPCDRREAHDPHPVPIVWCSEHMEPMCPRHQGCPGVKAHPNCMIGK